MARMKFLSDNLVFSTDPAKFTADFAPLTALPLVILVGLTGVGKSTVVAELQHRVPFTLLPNRRALTDDTIIAAMQTADGQPPHVETDRLNRFEYTARYRQKYPGGMAHALSRLALRLDAAEQPVLFDGLRGLNEVSAAVALFPAARFVVLDAPDRVRLTRLLTRNDVFDRVETQPGPTGDNTLAALRAVEGIDAVFSVADLQETAQIATRNGFSTADAAKKAAIIVTERRNYNPDSARDFLTAKLPPAQVVVVDTARHPPADVVAQIATWLVNGEGANSE